MVAGRLGFTVGHEGGLVRLELAHEVHQVVEGVAFDVELDARPVLGEQFRQVVHVVRADVARVRPWVHGDALRAGGQTGLGGAHHARDAEVARVAHQGHLVEVDRKRCAPGMEMRGHGHDDGVR
ncbi:hypothetical protein D9M69_554930 [compost metagenome]